MVMGPDPKKEIRKFWSSSDSNPSFHTTNATRIIIRLLNEICFEDYLTTEDF
jgi:hypothetical protein